METENVSESIREPTADGGAQISAAIEKILANPELIGMVASALSSAPKGENTVSDTEADTQKSSAEKDAVPTAARELPDMAASLMPILSSLGTASKVTSVKGNDRRTCLLGALKPYLCKERCEAIDYMIKLARIADVFRGMS